MTSGHRDQSQAAVHRHARFASATLVAHETLGAAGQRLLDDRMLNVVLVLVFATSVLGPVLTERIASRLTTGTPRTELDRRSDPHQM